MILGISGGILFDIGMCICLLMEQDSFRQGIIGGAMGAVVILEMHMIRCKIEGKPVIQLSVKPIVFVLLGLVDTLGLGVDMRITVVWNMLLLGVLVGIAEIVFLLCLVP